MAYLDFISFINRTYFSIYTHHSRFVLKKTIGSSLNNGLISRSHVSTSKIAVLKPNITWVSLCQPKPQFKRSIKIQIFRMKHTASILEHLRHFHTSERRYLHSRLRPVWKFLAVMGGRAFRKWRDHSPKKGKYFIEMIKNRGFIDLSFAVCGFPRYVFAIACVILSVMYYVSHIEETPITKRRRFIAFNSKQLEKFNEFQLQQMLTDMQNDVLPTNHQSYSRVKAVVDCILTANQNVKEIKEKKLSFAVLKDCEENAFSHPAGYVFVCTGLLSLCSTDGELAAVLCHEIAHIILNHGLEKCSLREFLQFILIVIVEAICAIMPSDSLSSVIDLLHKKYGNKIIKIFKFTYNRKMETEADTVGLQLAARACFDIRESSAFWDKMAILQRFDKVPILDTHPSHEKRSEYLNSIMDQAIDLRNECGCPKLKSCDPRSNVEVLTKALEAAKCLQQIQTQ